MSKFVWIEGSDPEKFEKLFITFIRFPNWVTEAPAINNSKGTTANLAAIICKFYLN